MTDTTRRQFLELTGATGAAAITAGFTATARGYAKNETIRIGVIGCGGRAGGRLMPKAMALPGVEVVAVCDVYKVALERTRAEAAKHTKGEVFATAHHEKLLERKDIDAVIIGTPDHWHVPVTVDACAAGKDVYCEKPLTHKLSEGEEVVAAQNQHKRIVQVGTQQRSMPQVIKAREIVKAGTLGDVHKVHMTWNRNHTPFRKHEPPIREADIDWKRFLGNAPKQPFDPYRARGNWRWFWDFGGGILTDLMVHWQDTVQFLLGLDELPSKAVTIGDNYSTAGVWQTPDSIQTLLDYPKRKMQLHFEGTFVNQHEKAGLTLMGTNGTLYVDRGRYELTPEPRHKFEAQVFKPGSGEKGADFDVDGTSLHLANWLECVRTRKTPAAPAEAGVLAAGAAHLGNQALREAAKG